jgi:type II secretory pathway pseudopilin PulG
MQQRNRQRGLTLVEALIALAVAGLIVATLLMVYVQGTRGFTHLQSQSLTERIAEMALLEIESACRQAMYAEVKGGRLILTFPRDTDTYGKPLPVDKNDSPTYRPGTKMIYYLSDPSGALNRRGTILWRGTLANNGSVQPDPSWSLLGNRQGRIMPLTEFTPSVQINPAGIVVTLTVRSTIQTGGERYETRRTRTFLVQNANTWR